MIDPISHFLNALLIIWEHLPAAYFSFTLIVFVFSAVIIIVRIMRGL